MSTSNPPRVLTIAGSDSSGGAGVEADLKVITAHACYGQSCITGLTAQNTLGVHGIHVVPSSFVSQCLDAVFNDIGADVVKTGMLTCKSTVETVADAMETYKVKKLVVDPVMVSTSGHQLLPDDAVEVLLQKLLPKTFLLTPNIPEAVLLLEKSGVGTPQELKSRTDLIALAKILQSLGPQAVLLKGGHLPFTAENTASTSPETRSKVLDILYIGGADKTVVLESPFLDTKNTHGTGCSLASAIAANIALGKDLPAAVRDASAYIARGISTAPAFSKGGGPINHLHPITPLPFTRGHFIPYLLSHPKIVPLWHGYTHHQFVATLATGTLEKRQFQHYLVQDYLFLTQFARANALVGYKGSDIASISKAAGIVRHIEKEMGLHLEFCKGWGMEEEEIKSSEESMATVAYTRWVLDIGMSGDLLGLLVAMAPCLVGYGAIAERVWAEGEGRTLDPDDGVFRAKKEGNPYWNWVENYVAADYQEAVKEGRELIEEFAGRVSNERVEELVELFAKAVKLETAFWQMGLDLS